MGYAIFLPMHDVEQMYRRLLAVNPEAAERFFEFGQILITKYATPRLSVIEGGGGVEKPRHEARQ